MKPTIKEVKEYFKDAETVKGVSSGTVYTYTGINIHYSVWGWWCDSLDGDYLELWDKERGFAEIITYKNSKQMKTLKRKDYKRIYDIACSTWKPKLQELFGAEFAIKDEVKIKDSIYKMMRNACTDEQHTLFNEIFGKDKKELEVGKWYTYTDSKIHLLCITKYDSKEIEGYGFNLSGWVDSDSWCYRNLIEATQEEVETALIKEAEKRGFVEGVKVKDLLNDELGIIDEYDLNNKDYEIDEKNSFNFGNKTIFYNGKWAEIIKEEPKTYKIGQRFKSRYGKKYMLVQSETDRVCLISLKGGNRWTQPIKVEDAYNITAEELNKITVNQTEDFTLYKE